MSQITFIHFLNRIMNKYHGSFLRDSYPWLKCAFQGQVSGCHWGPSGFHMPLRDIQLVDTSWSLRGVAGISTWLSYVVPIIGNLVQQSSTTHKAELAHWRSKPRPPSQETKPVSAQLLWLPLMISNGWSLKLWSAHNNQSIPVGMIWSCIYVTGVNILIWG